MGVNEKRKVCLLTRDAGTQNPDLCVGKDTGLTKATTVGLFESDPYFNCPIPLVYSV